MPQADPKPPLTSRKGWKNLLLRASRLTSRLNLRHRFPFFLLIFPNAHVQKEIKSSRPKSSSWLCHLQTLPDTLFLGLPCSSGCSPSPLPGGCSAFLPFHSFCKTSRTDAFPHYVGFGGVMKAKTARCPAAARGEPRDPICPLPKRDTPLLFTH